MYRFSKISWMLMGIGTLLLVQGAYLVSVKVTHMGVILPALLGTSAWMLALKGAQWRKWLELRPRARMLWLLVCVGFFVWLISLCVFFWVMQQQTSMAWSGKDPEVLVVLGSSTPGAQPSPALAQRLRLAYGVAQKYPQAKVVVSGGVDFRQTVSEAQVMSTYLQSLGLDLARIWLEDRSTSTHENLVFSARVLQSHGLDLKASIVVISNDFHTLRAGWIAKKVGYQNVQTLGAPTPLYMRYNAWLREYFACLSGWIFGEF